MAVFILINFIINSISAQDGYSRAFNPHTDDLMSSDVDVYKATFTRDRIINLISEYNYWPEKWFVKVDLKEVLSNSGGCNIPGKLSSKNLSDDSIVS